MVNALSPLCLVASIVALIVAIIFARGANKNGTHARIEEGLFATSGLMQAGILLFAQSEGMRHLLLDIRGWHLLGLNFMLLACITAGVLMWLECFHRKSAQNHWHYIRTPVAAFVFGLTLPLWSLHGITPGGVGLILACAGLVFIRRKGAEARWTCCALIGLGMALMAVWLIAPAAWLLHKWVLSIPVYMGIAAVIGAFLYVQHRRSEGGSDDYHHAWTPFLGGLLLALAVAGIGAPFRVHAAYYTSKAVLAADRTDAGHHGPGDYGNPMDYIRWLVMTSMDKQGGASHG